MVDEINVIVARVKIVGRVEMLDEAPELLRGAPGDRLVVKFPFMYEEVSRGKDDFRLQLTSKFAGREAESARHEHTDRRGLTDDQRGFIMQDYLLPAPGMYELEWRAAAEYNEEGDRQKEVLEGKVPVEVIDTTPPPL